METQTASNSPIEKSRQPDPPRKSRKGIPQTHKPHQKRNSHDPKLAKHNPRPLELVPRGESILIEIDRARFLTNGQIGELLFRRTLTQDNTLRADTTFQKFANRSLRDLLALGLIEKVQTYQTHRRTGNVFQDGVNILSPKGLTALKKILDRQDSVEPVRSTPALREFSFRKIDHELAITDMLIALRRAVWSLGVDCDVFDIHDDDQLSRLKGFARFDEFTPDFWCVVQTPDGLFPLFGEADRGTEMIESTTGSTKDWKTKLMRYGQYISTRYHSDPFYVSLGYDTRAMRWPVVLTMTTSDERRANMLKVTPTAGGAGAYWYTTKEAVFGPADPDYKQSPFGMILEPIWQHLAKEPTISLRDYLLPSQT